jgi:hypothetical protein
MGLRKAIAAAELKWLVGSLVLFLSIRAVTYHRVTTDEDDQVVARLSSPVSLIQPECLSGANDRPVDLNPECRVPDPFESVTGNGCRWRKGFPLLSCRVGGLPVTLLVQHRLGGAEQLPLTVLSRVLSPLRTSQVALELTKFGVLLLLFWMVRLFHLPLQLLPLIAVSPVFHGLSQFSWSAMLHWFFFYLVFCLVVSPGRRKFVAGIAALACGTYLYSSTPITVVAAMAVLHFGQKRSRRALLLGVSAGVCLLLRFAIYFAHPLLRGFLEHDLGDSGVWSKPVAQYLAYLKGTYDLFSLSYEHAGFFPPSTPIQPGALDLLFRLLGFGVFSMLMFSGFALRENLSKRIRTLVGLYLISAGAWIFVGHFAIYRLHYFFPIALIATYWSAQTLSRWLRERGAQRLSYLPMAWLWGTALLSCGLWIHGINRVGPPMSANSDFHADLGRHLLLKGVRTPLMTNSEAHVGMIDVFSGETVRPLYVDALYAAGYMPKGDPVERVLWTWPRLSGGTLLQSKVQETHGESYTLSRSDIEKFAARNGIEIRGVELFPYGESEGFWIIDFVNHRW